MLQDIYRCTLRFIGITAFISCFLLPIQAVQGQGEGQYPQDNDEDYYYNYYTPDKTVNEAKKDYPQDNDADYYQNYYYDYKAGKGDKYQQYYYPGDDEEREQAPSGSADYYGKPYPEDNDTTYYKDRTFFPSVNQYD